jgi:hypothetical protein
MAFAIVSPPLLGSQPIAETSATQRHPLGTIVTAVDPVYLAGEFIYLQAAGTTDLGAWVTYLMDGGTAGNIAADAIGPVAIAMVASVAGSYNWYQIQGKAVGKVLAGYVDNANVYTASGGIVDDTVVAGDRVKRAKGASAIGTPAAGLAEFEIDRPFVDDGLAA